MAGGADFTVNLETSSQAGNNVSRAPAGVKSNFGILTLRDQMFCSIVRVPTGTELGVDCTKMSTIRIVYSPFFLLLHSKRILTIKLIIPSD